MSKINFARYHPPRPSRSLDGRAAIVTGAGTAGNGLGNGRAAATLLAEAGARVVCADLSLPDAEHTAAIVNEELPSQRRAVAVQADVTDEAACKRVVITALETFGRLDILVNNVGVFGPDGTALEVDMDAWAKAMDINVGSMVKMAKHAIPAMQLNPKNPQTMSYRGSIVNIGSVAGLRGGTPALLYPTSKGAVVNLTRAMAAQHASHGIRVNCVCPGMVYTPMVGGQGMSEEKRRDRRERSLLRTEGNAWDVGCAVRYLAGEEGRWCTGVVLPVDAGATASTSIKL
ncbi:MAG: hypothetical protein M1828_005169 [Chrysothrix sp. TS-e1954]|nr:MAG: hypothetical protein M1828_005169 [Chrysothrix sp. TS-e1954]